MFQPCREAAPIRVIHLNHAAIWNAVEIVIVAVDETNIFGSVSGSQMRRLPMPACGMFVEYFFFVRSLVVVVVVRTYVT